MAEQVLARRNAVGDLDIPITFVGDEPVDGPGVGRLVIALLGDLEPFKADHIKVGCVIDLRAIQSVTVSCTVPRCDKSERTDRS